MAEQQQFLNVIDRDEAERRFHAALDLRPLAAEIVPLAAALGRVLAEDVRSPVDVPSFDRSNVDGYRRQWPRIRSARASSSRGTLLLAADEVIATRPSCRRPPSRLARQCRSPPAAWCRAARMRW